MKPETQDAPFQITQEMLEAAAQILEDTFDATSTVARCAARSILEGFAGQMGHCVIGPSPKFESEISFIRNSISDTMLLAGINALEEWNEKKERRCAVNDTDLICAVYAAMHLRV